MYEVTKRLEVAGAHSLTLPYASKCSDLHGHNWIIWVSVKARELNPCSMVVDFTIIKSVVDQLDHANVNDVLGKSINPTAENIARWIAEQIDSYLKENGGSTGLYATAPHAFVSKVVVQESEGNTACYQPD